MKREKSNTVYDEMGTILVNLPVFKTSNVIKVVDLFKIVQGLNASLPMQVKSQEKLKTVLMMNSKRFRLELGNVYLKPPPEKPPPNNNFQNGIPAVKTEHKQDFPNGSFKEANGSFKETSGAFGLNISNKQPMSPNNMSARSQSNASSTSWDEPDKVKDFNPKEPFSNISYLSPHLRNGVSTSNAEKAQNIRPPPPPSFISRPPFNPDMFFDNFHSDFSGRQFSMPSRGVCNPPPFNPVSFNQNPNNQIFVNQSQGSNLHPSPMVKMDQQFQAAMNQQSQAAMNQQSQEAMNQQSQAAMNQQSQEAMNQQSQPPMKQHPQPSMNQHSHGPGKTSYLVNGTEVLLLNDFRGIDIGVKHLHTCPFVALDCKVVGSGSPGRISLIQMATHSRVYLFDLISMDKKTFDHTCKLLGSVLSDTVKTSKITHDCRRFRDSLFYELNIQLANVFDTQAAYMRLMKMNETESSHYPVLSELLEKYCTDQENGPDETAHSSISEDLIAWEDRPLTREMIEYASKDLISLFKLREGILLDLTEYAENECYKEGTKYASIGHDEKDYNSVCASVSPYSHKVMSLNSKHELVLEEELTEDEKHKVFSVLNVETDPHAMLLMLPLDIWNKLMPEPSERLQNLKEIVLDLGSPPIGYFFSSSERMLIGKDSYVLTKEDLEKIVSKLPKFRDGSRVGIDGSLHRISCIMNRFGDVVGLTLRLGRVVRGCAHIFLDLIQNQVDKSILLLGPKGCGKTMMLRDIARILSEKFRVMIIDSFNDIGGDGDVPHSSIGQARRIQVQKIENQGSLMVECVRNHNPEIIIVDEIGPMPDAHAAQFIIQRGIRLIASMEGRLTRITSNPVLVELMGGVTEIIMDCNALNGYNFKKSSGSNLRRKQNATFQTVIEMNPYNLHLCNIYHDANKMFDGILQGSAYNAEIRNHDTKTDKITVQSVMKKGSDDA